MNPAPAPSTDPLPVADRPRTPANRGMTAAKLLESGIIFTLISFCASLVYYLFQIVISRQFANAPGEFGLMNNTIAIITFLSLPLTIATQAVTHYIARFHFGGDDARLHGLLGGCRKFLFHITLAGSVLAVVLVKPVGDFFHIPRYALTFIVLACVLGNLWCSYASALCQGLGWFKRLALISLLASVARLAFGWPTTKMWPIAEWAVLASLVMLLPNLILLFWRSDFPKRKGATISPWDGDFVQFIIVSSACCVGSYFFNQGDTLVAQRYFTDAERDAYSSAEKLAVALVTAVGPLLIVLFTQRSHQQHRQEDLANQLKLLGLYTGGLVFGAICLYLVRGFGLQLLHRNTPEAVAMVGRISIAMVFVGLLQALAMWSLASRWIKISLLYGALGLGYWALLLVAGKTPAALLDTMPFATGGAFGLLFVFWLLAMRQHAPAADIGPATPSAAKN